MAKTATFIMILVMSLILLVFTASRTLDLLQTFLPGGQQQAFAYLGLVAFDGGLLGWSLFFTYGARGQYQRAIALIMIVVSLLAVGVSTIADLYLNASNKGLLASLNDGQRLSILLVVGLVIVLNITAFFLTHITEPERLRTMATESAKDLIHAETLKQIHAAAPIVASEVAPQLTREWVQATVREMIPNAAPPMGKETLHLPAVQTGPAPASNGNGVQSFRSQP